MSLEVLAEKLEGRPLLFKLEYALVTPEEFSGAGLFSKLFSLELIKGSRRFPTLAGTNPCIYFERGYIKRKSPSDDLMIARTGASEYDQSDSMYAKKALERRGWIIPETYNHLEKKSVTQAELMEIIQHLQGEGWHSSLNVLMPECKWHNFQT
jgi:hypothetical protein